MGRSGTSKPAWKAGGYAAHELVGYGASSQVWRGRALRSGLPVALKVLEPTDAAAHRAARAEAALLSALDHPHLLRLHELVSDGEHAILVLDYAGGGSLAELLDRRSRITVGELVTVMSPIAAAVAYLHEEGLVHGDIAPANILFTADGQPLLADLGVAAMMGNSDEPRSTLAYLDPAVADGGAAGLPSDVFMLAATSLHALVGRPPWVAATAQGLVDAAALGDIPELDELLAHVPGDVAAIVRRGLSTLPHARGTAAEFALDLRHAAAPAPVELTAGRLRSGGAREPDTGLSDVDASESEPEPADVDSHGGRPHQGGGLVLNGAEPADGYASSAYRARHRPPPTAAAETHARSGSRPVRVRAFRETAAADVVLDRPDFVRPVPAAAPNRVRGAGGLPVASRDADAQGAVDDVVAMSLTHQVRARVRPPVPPSRFARWRPGSGPRRAAVTTASVGAGVVAACVAAALVTGWHPPGVGATAAGDTPKPNPASTSKSTSSSTPTPTAVISSGLTLSSAARARTNPSTTKPIPRRTPVQPSRSAPDTQASSNPPAGSSSPPQAASRWERVLAALDAHREQAFAAGDAGQLAHVYVPGTLRSQDAAVLRRTVRPGCALRGLHTTYRVLRVLSDDTDEIVVAASVTLSSAVLRCPPGVVQHTAPVDSTAMTIRLVATNAGYRIAALRQTAAG